MVKGRESGHAVGKGKVACQPIFPKHTFALSLNKRRIIEVRRRGMHNFKPSDS
jgi:hypothetical protein